MRGDLRRDSWGVQSNLKLPLRQREVLQLSVAVFLLCCCLLAVPATAQQQDPENEKGTGLWLDQTISAGLSPNSSLEFEFHQRFDQGASNLFEYFFQ